MNRNWKRNGALCWRYFLAFSYRWINFQFPLNYCIVSLVTMAFTVGFVIVAGFLGIHFSAANSAEIGKTRCDEGWTALTSDKCIKLFFSAASNRFPLQLSYEDAREHCRSQFQGSSLVVIRSKEELLALERLLLRPNNQLNSGSSIWVDEAQPRMQYEFRTIDNADLSGFGDFLGFPRGISARSNNNGTTAEISRGGCVRMMLGVRKELALSWRSEPCTTKLAVVCEKSPLPPLDPETLEELQAAYLSTKAELNETKVVLKLVSQILIDVRKRMLDVHSEVTSLEGRFKRSEIQIMTNTLEIAKVKFNTPVDIDSVSDEKQPESLGPAVQLTANASQALNENLSPEVPEKTNAIAENKTEAAIPTIPKVGLRCPPHHLPPIGFVYTQYPGQAPPSALWPTAVWKEITSQYAGLFFRAEGGNSSPFGDTQEDSSPRITSLHSTRREAVYDNVELLPGELSPALATGIYYLGYWPHWTGVRFNVSGGEVRPRNMAIRVFRRS